MKLDLNCDLGEGEPLARTRALMGHISSANVACGGHAGDVRTMQACVRLVKKFGVRLGAHPGAWNQEHRGRGEVQVNPDELELLLLHQVGALEVVARAHRVRLCHIKLHGALYHVTEQDASLARRYLETVRRCWPGVRIYARAGGQVFRRARRMGVPVWEEAFADRSYQDDGSLVPRSESNALIASVDQVVARAHDLMNGRGIQAVSGKRLRLSVQTLCVHSDTPGALAMARRLKSAQAGRAKLFRSPE